MFQEQHSLQEIAQHLKLLYHGGNGIGGLTVWYAQDGIRLSRKPSARYDKAAQIFTWEAAAERIGQLLNTGEFATELELEEAEEYERFRLAEKLWVLYYDFSDEAREAGYLPSLANNPERGFPAESAWLTEQLKSPVFLKSITEEYTAFRAAYQQDRNLMRFHYHKHREIWESLQNLSLPRITFSSQLSEAPVVRQFITEDEIDADIARGNGFEGGKGRIFTYFQESHTDKEKVDFLRHEYGIGGHSHALSNARGSDESHDGKGLHYKKDGCPDVHFTWEKVSNRITDLIRKGRYLTEQEQAAYDKVQTEKALAEAEEMKSVGDNPLETAKRLIDEFCRDEYDSPPDFSDLSHIGIAYTTTEDSDIPIEVFANLLDFSIERHLNGVLFGVQKFDTLEQMITDALQFLDFDELVAVTDEEVKQAASEKESAEEMYREKSELEAEVEAWEKQQAAEKQAVLNTLSEQELTIVRAMETAGFIFTPQSANPGLHENLVFTAGDYGYPITFENWEQAYKWIDSAILRDTPGLREQVQQILHPETQNSVHTNEEHPVSIQVNGEWQTFPNTKAAEEAAYEEYKNNLRRNAENFHITDEHLGEGGPKAKFQANIEAIKLLKYLEKTTEQATPEQQVILSRYVGWGGLADAFDPEKPSWSAEYAQLKELLTPEEYTAARASTLNAHYTSPTIIRAIYEAVGNMGFETGNILEPSCGVGNFFGMLPEKMRGSQLYGVELDSISGRIARQLYPKAHITVAGFETTDQRDFFDLAVGNVPFGQYQVNDSAYNKLHFNIHNYFFAKALDQVRPGGVVAFVTSRFTMDAKDSTVRRYLAQRAELLGAIRLPNNAFKANAGAEVVSDIIFLQKRDRPLDVVPDWTQTGRTEDGFVINRYFIDHPGMVLGRQEAESTAHGMDYTVSPIEGAELEGLLQKAVKHIHGTYQEAELPELGEGEAPDTSIPADPNVRNYSYALVDGTVYFRENSRMVRPSLNATAEARVKGMIGLRDCVRELITLQLDNSTTAAEIQAQQTTLNQLYNSFSSQYGLINSRANRLAFSDDSSYYLLCALEVIDEDGQLERKADMFTRRTIKPHEAVLSVDTASDALAVSISERACVDMAYMEQLTGKSEDELAEELKGVIFRIPDFSQGEAQYVTADEYLSGNVRQKLRDAKQAAAVSDLYRPNVEALSQVQPQDLDASEIDVRLGATWIDKAYIQQFMHETFATPYYLQRSIQVNYSSLTAEWQITGKSNISRSDVAAYTTFGTDRANAYKILEDSLNLRDVRIYDTVEDSNGKERRVLNPKETTLAAQKQQAIREAFRDWIWRDPERRQALVRQYNEEMNSTRPREYDGSHITFGGMNPEIVLREHQLGAIAHILYGGNTLLAHEVGAGKTFEMVAAAMESKRLGLCQKSLFVVPNHLTEQWASEFLRLYPAANILVTSKKDFEPQNRKKFCARIATGDYDAVIMGHSQFERIPISRERQERLLEEQIDEITDGIAEVKLSGGERFTIKELERTRKALEAKLEKLQADSRKDDVVTFEELGVDRLFVDEAHAYKNLFLFTKMRNVAGLSTSDAQKSSDMFAKCRYMDELTGNRGVVFATGTPVSNSMTELYTMQRYLQYDRLKELNMTHFDCWASRFGETVTALELAPEGYNF